MPSIPNRQKGSVPVLVLVAVVGLVAFLAVGSIANFNTNLFNTLFPKPPSHASGATFAVEPETGTIAGSATSVNDGTASNGKVLQFNAGQKSGVVVNVTSKGATANDSTDDTAAIQAAINQVGTSGGSVYFPAGKYISGILKVPSNITIFGDYGPMTSGGSPSIIEAKNDLPGGVTRFYALFTPLNYDTSSTKTSNVTIHDLKLLGNSMGQWDYSNDGIRNGFPMGQFVTAAVAASKPANEIITVSGQPYWLCQSCSMIGVGLFATNNWVVQRVWAEDWDGDGIYLGRANTGFAPAGSSDMNMVIDNVVRRNIRNGMMLSDGDKNLIKNNLFEEDQIGLAPTFPNNPSQPNTKNCAVLLGTTCNLQVTNPYTSAEFDLEPNFSGSQHGNQNIFENNTFQNGYYNGMQVTRQQSGMDMNQFLTNLFKNNKNQQMLVQSNGVSNTLIQGNQFVNNPAQSSVRHLRIATSVDGTYVIGNKFIGGAGGFNSSEAIKVDSAGAVPGPDLTVFQDNTFDLTGGSGDGMTIKYEGNGASTRNYFTGLNNSLSGGANVSGGTFLTPPPPAYPAFSPVPVPAGCTGNLVNEANKSTVNVDVAVAGSLSSTLGS